MNPIGDNRRRENGFRIFSALGSTAIADAASLEGVGLRDGCKNDTHQRRPGRITGPRQCLAVTIAKVAA